MDVTFRTSMSNLLTAIKLLDPSEHRLVRESNVCGDVGVCQHLKVMSGVNNDYCCQFSYKIYDMKH